MSNRIYVELLASRMDQRSVVGKVGVVVDVLRATTTITQALHAGARAVLPCLSIEQARRRASQMDEGTVLLGGERGGERIQGFDLGNSPVDYSPERVLGTDIVFTTTNGTAAMSRCSAASRILLGAFVNLSAVAQRLAELESDVVIVCAGTGGEITREDSLFAGSLVERLIGSGAAFQAGDDSAAIVLDAWRHVSVGATAGAIARALHESRGGRNLNRIGLGHDVDWAARIDALAVVPELDWKTRSVTRVR